MICKRNVILIVAKGPQISRKNNKVKTKVSIEGMTVKELNNLISSSGCEPGSTSWVHSFFAWSIWVALEGQEGQGL